MGKVRLLILAGIACSLCNCMSIIGTKGAIREYYRGHNGLITTGKSEPNKADEYHNTQQRYDKERTFRYNGGQQAEEYGS